MVPVMRCTGFCFWCYEGAKGRAYYPGHYGFRQQKRKRRTHNMGRFADRSARCGDSGGMGDFVASPADLEAFPDLVEFLTLMRFSDGTTREPGTLMVFLQEGRLKYCLSDKAEGRVAFRCFDSLHGLLEAIEEDIREGTLDWRKSRELKPPRR